MTAPNTISSTSSVTAPKRPKMHHRMSTPTKSRSSIPPRVLPFPDTAIRSLSREGSRAGSPTGSPRLTPRGSADGPYLQVTAVEMVTGRSHDGNTSGHERERTGSSGGGWGPGMVSSVSPPPVSSPLALASASTPHLNYSAGGPSRPRAHTGPVTSPPVTRSFGFVPTPLSSPPIASPSEARPSSLPGPSIPNPPASTLRPPTTTNRPPSIKKATSNVSTAVPSNQPSNAHSTQNQALADHMYTSFLNGSCADVRIWVRKWNVAWLVHKVVLVQAGFFHSLFLGGFSEMNNGARRRSSRKGKERARDDGLGQGDEDDWFGEDVELQFDDPNITRAAFEICLSRLYSPYPLLQFPPTLLPTPTHPLSPAFPNTNPSQTYQSLSRDLPPNTHLATPRLLLSLLATTIYLGHGMMKEVMVMILRTISPFTVGRYLDFAIGEGVGGEEWEGQDGESARGLERVGRELPRRIVESANQRTSHGAGEGDTQEGSHDPDGTREVYHLEADLTERHEDEENDSKVSGTSIRSNSASMNNTHDIARTNSHASTRTIRPRIQGHTTTTSTGTVPLANHNPNTTMNPRLLDSPAPGSNRDNDDNHEEGEEQPSHHHFYGFASNKIGEACICWLTRWGVDVLNAELSPLPLSSASQLESSYSQGNNWAIDSGPEGGDREWKIWSHRGIPPSFARAVLASDNLFVRDEMERYLLTRRVLELRRRGWEREFDGHSHAHRNTLGHRSGSGYGGSACGYGDIGFRERNEGSDVEGEDDGMEAWDEDEVELGKVFAEGIYYSHMTFDDLAIIAADIDTSTGLPYAPLQVLQSAHWASANLRSRIQSYAPPSHPASPGGTPADQSPPELGLTLSSSEIVSRNSQRRFTPRSRVVTPSGDNTSSTISLPAGYGSSSGSSIGLNQVYHPIPTDDTHRVGAGGLIFQPTTSQNSSIPLGSGSSLGNITGIPDLGPNANDFLGDNTAGGAGDTSLKSKPPQSEKTFFGLLGGSRSAREIIETYSADQWSTPPIHRPFGHHLPTTPSGVASPHSNVKTWTTIQPFRFSVEFWNIDKLAENERLYSTTHFHAGSLWNVYVQTIRRKEKGVQLGIYLHRQSWNETVPIASAPVPVGAGRNDGVERGAYVGGRLRDPPGSSNRLGHGHGFGGGPFSTGDHDSGDLGSAPTANDPSGSGRFSRSYDLSSPIASGSNIGTGTTLNTVSLPTRHGRSSSASAVSRGHTRSASAEMAVSPSNPHHAGSITLGNIQGNPVMPNNPVWGAVAGGSASPSRRESESDRVDGEYRDQRRVTRAYFSISCASALGTALIRFTSSPDNFTTSQSWGWKASALRNEEFLAAPMTLEHLYGTNSTHPADQDDGVLGWVGEIPLTSGKDTAGGDLGAKSLGTGAEAAGIAAGVGRGSLRATVVVGVV